MHFEQTHPEQGSDELFIGNITIVNFRESGYKTKRLGIIAYDVNNKIIKKIYEKNNYPAFLIENNNLYPMFVNMVEYDEHMRSCKGE